MKNKKKLKYDISYIISLFYKASLFYLFSNLQALVQSSHDRTNIQGT